MYGTQRSSSTASHGTIARCANSSSSGATAAVLSLRLVVATRADAAVTTAPRWTVKEPAGRAPPDRARDGREVTRDRCGHGTASLPRGYRPWRGFRCDKVLRIPGTRAQETPRGPAGNRKTNFFHTLRVLKIPHLRRGGLVQAMRRHPLFSLMRTARLDR